MVCKYFLHRNYNIIGIINLDNMKESITAKLAQQCEELYAETLKIFQRDGLKSLWDKDWVPLVI